MTPDRIGRYAVVRELGAGSFGRVFLAEGSVPRKGARSSRRERVAIKQLSGEWTLHRFETLVREYELLDRVKHRSLCRVHEFLDRDNAVVMELVEGVTLRALLEALGAAGEAVWPDAALEIAAEIADCLYQAHATPGPGGRPLHLVHRDLKPENVMLTSGGEVKVLDFGLAHMDGGVREPDVTGTPLYMAPEQARGEAIDHRTDLFAVGLVLLELLSGRAAYPVPSRDRDSVVSALLDRIDRADLGKELERLERTHPRCAPVLRRCLARDPRDRHDDGHVLLLDLVRAVEHRGALADFARHVFDGPLKGARDSGPPAAAGMMHHPSREGSHTAMAKNPDPARPAGPPPPAAPSRPRPPPAARPPPRPAAGGKMWAPPEKDASATAGGGLPSKPPGTENLRMVPLTEDEQGVDPTGNHSATTFFALPAPKRPAGGDPDEPIQSLRRHDPIAAAAAPTGAQPMAPPPGAYVPPMTPMQPMAAPMVPLGIQGPVASGPMYGGMPHSAQLPPDLQQDVQRAQSYRVFALVAGLMFMVLSAVIVTVILTVGVVVYQQRETPKDPVVSVVQPPAPHPVVDTGVKPVALPPVPSPKPTPRPSPNPSPHPSTPKPPPAPSSDPAQVTVTLGPGAPPFTSIEVKCAASGFRERGDFVGGVAKVPAVPREDCDVFFKGGPPAKSKISGGQSKTCSFQGVAANCQ